MFQSTELQLLLLCCNYLISCRENQWYYIENKLQKTDTPLIIFDEEYNKYYLYLNFKENINSENYSLQCFHEASLMSRKKYLFLMLENNRSKKLGQLIGPFGHLFLILLYFNFQICMINEL